MFDKKSKMKVEMVRVNLVQGEDSPLDSSEEELLADSASEKIGCLAGWQAGRQDGWSNCADRKRVLGVCWGLQNTI